MAELTLPMLSAHRPMHFEAIVTGPVEDGSVDAEPENAGSVDAGSIRDNPPHPAPGDGDSAAPQETVDLVALERAQLQAALASRDVIGQAKGMIRLLTGCDAAQAFEMLTKISQDTNRKLRGLAELIAETAPSGTPLPADVTASWRRHSATLPQPPSGSS